MSQSQNQKIIEHLQAGRAIDPLTALNKFGVMRLAARIHQLRSAGHQIQSVKKTVRNRLGEECSICIYRLIAAKKLENT